MTTHCWTTRYEAEGFECSSDWILEHFNEWLAANPNRDPWDVTETALDVCLLPDGHDGDHQFTSADEVRIEFVV